MVAKFEAFDEAVAVCFLGEFWDEVQVTKRVVDGWEVVMVVNNPC